MGSSLNLSVALASSAIKKGTRIPEAHFRERVGQDFGRRHTGLWNPFGRDPKIPRQALGRPSGGSRLLFVGNLVPAPPSEGSGLLALQQPHLGRGLTFSRLWSRTGSRMRPPIQAFIDRLANHTQGIQNVLCGKLNFSKCLCSAGVMKPAGGNEAAVGGGTCRRGGWQVARPRGHPGSGPSPCGACRDLGAPLSSSFFQQIITECLLCAVLG